MNPRIIKEREALQGGSMKENNLRQTKGKQWYHSFRIRLLSVIIPLLLLSILVIMGASIITTRSEVRSLIQSSSAKEIESIMNTIEVEFTAHEGIALGMKSVYLGNWETLDKQGFRQIMEASVSNNEATLGVGVWIEPYKYRSNMEYFGPYVYKDGNNVVYTEEYEGKEYDYPTTDWYMAAKSAGQSTVWTSPYYDETTGITMITTAVPLYINDEFVGAITADYDLTTIQNTINQVQIKTSGFAILVDNEGNILAHRNQDYAMTASLYDIDGYKDVASLFEQDEIKNRDMDVQGESYLVSQQVLPSTGWKIMTFVPEAESYNVIDHIIQQGILVAVIVTIIGIIVVLLFSQRLTKGISNFVSRLNYLAKGDFTHPVEYMSKDEIGQMGQAYNQILEELRGLMRTVNEGTNHVSETAEELSVSTNETSQSIIEVAESIQEIATNSHSQITIVDDLSAQASRIHEYAIQMNQSVKETTQSVVTASDSTQRGGEYVKQVIGQMTAINEQVTTSSTAIHQLEDKSKQIESIISIITGISEQTNLLALNAAIEAARAGEEGKGFAVVADEVRKLAEASSRSSADISQLIHEIQEEITESVLKMTQSTVATTEGIHIVEKTGTAFDDIAQAIERVTHQTTDIKDTITQITDGMDAILHIVHNLSETAQSNDENTQSVSAATQQQTAIIEQIHEATDSLADMTEKLHQEVSRFKI